MEMWSGRGVFGMLFFVNDQCLQPSTLCMDLYGSWMNGRVEVSRRPRVRYENRHIYWNSTCGYGWRAVIKGVHGFAQWRGEGAFRIAFGYR